MSSFSHATDGLNAADDLNASVETIIAVSRPKYESIRSIAELRTQLVTLVGLGRYVLNNGTSNACIFDMYRDCREKFCAYYPRHSYETLHEMVCVSIQFPFEVVRYDATRQFGMSKNQLKKYPKKYAQYMRTREFMCPTCSEIKPGTDFSDGRLIGRPKRRICKTCVTCAFAVR